MSAIPAEILAIAQATRAAFGDKVRLLYWADSEGNSQGRPENDDFEPRQPTPTPEAKVRQ